ncbi:MAG: response regulator [Coriobacteriales bacterium]
MAVARDQPTRVLIVDDQTLYREGLAGLMRHWPEFEVAGDVSNGLEAVEFCARAPVDLVLMDVRMPVMDGIEAAAAIHAAHPGILIVVLTVSNDEDTLYEAFSAGAVGYVLKDMASSQLRSHLQQAVRGDMVLSGVMTEKLVKRMLASAQRSGSAAVPGGGPHPELSDREVELLRLVAQGLSNDEIAAQMYISFGAVKKNLQALMHKLGMPNRVLLAGYAIRTGLVD